MAGLVQFLRRLASIALDSFIVFGALVAGPLALLLGLLGYKSAVSFMMIIIVVAAAFGAVRYILGSKKANEQRK
jgi:hypothetical protein